MSIKQTTVSFLHLLVEKMLKDYEIDDDGVICILSDNPRKKNHRSKSLHLNRNQQGCQNKLYPRQSHHQSPQQRRAHNKDGVYRHQKRRLTPTK